MREVHETALTLIHPYMHIKGRSGISDGHRHKNHDTACLLKTKTWRINDSCPNMIVIADGYIIAVCSTRPNIDNTCNLSI